MLAFSPFTMISAPGWQTAEGAVAMAGGDLHHEGSFARACASKETDTSYQSITFSPTPPELDAEDIFAGLMDPYSSSSAKKSSHNAYERHRRKQLNALYSSLRELIPGSDQTVRPKKLSIPVIISRVVKYIPELQREVQKLACRKEELLLTSTRQQEHRADHATCLPVVSASCVDDGEVMVQVMLSKDLGMSLGRVLRVLEGEGLRLLSASTCAAPDDKSICSLHLQATEGIRLQSQSFCEHLIQAVREQARR